MTIIISVDKCNSSFQYFDRFAAIYIYKYIFIFSIYEFNVIIYYFQRSCYGRSNSNPDIVSYADTDGEVSSILCRGLDRTASMRAAAVMQDNVLCAISMTQARKVLHEEIALQCVVSSGSTRELVLTNSCFFFDLIIRSMIEHLAATNRLDIPRKMRFCAQFFDDITTLVRFCFSVVIT